MNIPDEIRARLKRLSPYNGPFVPRSVKAMAHDIWGPDHPNHGGWDWEAGSGIYQCELMLCDMDCGTADIAGYVGIAPLSDGTFLLNFVIGPEWNIPEDLIFHSLQDAKRYLDTLLAVSSPEVPTSSQS